MNTTAASSREMCSESGFYQVLGQIKVWIGYICMEGHAESPHLLLSFIAVIEANALQTILV